MPQINDRHADTNNSACRTRAGARCLSLNLTVALVVAVSGLVGAAMVNAQVKTTARRKAFQVARASHKSGLLPDFVIKCASVYSPPPVGGPLASLMKIPPGLQVTVIVANIGLVAAHTIAGNANYPLEVWQGGGNAGREVITPILRPGQTYEAHPPLGRATGTAPNGADEFTFHVGGPKESNPNNDTYGPVVETDTDTCLSHHRPLQTASPLHASREVRRLVASPTNKPNLHPSPITKTPQNATVTMHKIGLAPRPRVMNPRALTAVRLPSGWATIGGALHASRPGLRLRLSAGHTLLSKLGSRGRLQYELLDASGRVVKRISAKTTIRLLHGNTLMLLEPKTHRQVLLGRITMAAANPPIRH